MGKANPDRMNGVNKVVYQLATQQVAAGENVQVWGFTHDLTKNYGTRNFATQLFPTPAHHSGPGAAFSQALKALAPADTIFHIHGGWVFPFYKAARLIRQAGIRYVATGHGAYNKIAMHRSKWTKKIYFQLCEKHFLRNASAIHCIGASEVTGIKGILETDRTVLVPYGMDTGRPARIAEMSGETFIFGFVGRLDFHTKGLDLMVRAFAERFSTDDKAVLWLVGDGKGREAVSNLAKELAVSHKVKFWGAKFGEDKDDLLRRMHAFLHPSRNEGLPSAVIEAAAMGIPCIVTDATNVGEYLRGHRAGYVVPNEDVQALGQAMVECRLLKNGERKELGKRAAEMVVDRFSWPVIVRQFNELYA